MTKDGVVILPKFGYASLFRDGYAVVSAKMPDGYWGFGIIDAAGQYTMPPRSLLYQPISLGGGLFEYFEYVPLDGGSAIGCGVINSRGDTIHPAKAAIDYSSAVDNGMIPVRNDMRNSYWYYMDYNGNIVLDNQFITVTPFYEGYAWVRDKTSRLQLIDTKGNVVLSDPKWEGCSWKQADTGFHNGLALIRLHKNDTTKAMYINTNGDIIYSWIAWIDDSPSHSDDETYEIVSNQRDDTMGYINEADIMEEFTEQTLHFSSTRFKRNIRNPHKNGRCF